MKTDIRPVHYGSSIQRSWLVAFVAMFLFPFCLTACSESGKHCFDNALYFDSQGNKTDEYIEGGIQIEYHKNDLTEFAVSNSSLTTFTHLLYRVKNGMISSVHVTIKKFVDSDGNISYDNPAEVTTQTIEFESTKPHVSPYEKIGCDALRAINQSVSEKE